MNFVFNLQYYEYVPKGFGIFKIYIVMGSNFSFKVLSKMRFFSIGSTSQEHTIHTTSTFKHMICETPKCMFAVQEFRNCAKTICNLGQLLNFKSNQLTESEHFTCQAHSIKFTQVTAETPWPSRVYPRCTYLM